MNELSADTLRAGESACQPDAVLYFICLGALMIVLDTTIVTVALPSIATDVGVSAQMVPWLINAYSLPFGGLLLLGGRLGDLYGKKRMFLAGIAVFTLASMVCGSTASIGVLIAARALQGSSGAIVSATALSLVLTLYNTPAVRAQAVSIYGFVCAAGGAMGNLTAGVLTRVVGWHSIFLVNVPIGVFVFIACLRTLPPGGRDSSGQRLDIAGSVGITAAFVAIVYATGDVSGYGGIWLGIGLLLLGGFFLLQRRATHPLVPLRLLRIPSVGGSIVSALLWAGGSFAWSVVCALYLQRVQGYEPLSVGLAFLPSTAIIAIFSCGWSAAIVKRFGAPAPFFFGLLLTAVALAWFARAPSDASFLKDILPGMLLHGLGTGLACTPFLIAATQDVNARDSGVVSGLITTAWMLGSGLGVALLTRVVYLWGEHLQRLGLATSDAMNGGFQAAFFLASLLVGLAACVSAVTLGVRRVAPAAASQPT